MFQITKTPISEDCEKKIYEALDNLIKVTEECNARVTDVAISAKDKGKSDIEPQVSVCAHFKAVSVCIHF